MDTLIEELAARGIAVSVLPGGRLAVAPASALTADDRERIAQAKAGIVARLTGTPAWSPTGRSWCCPCGANVSAVGLAAGLPCPCCGHPAPDLPSDGAIE